MKLSQLFPCLGHNIEQNIYALRTAFFALFERLQISHHVAGGAWAYLQARYTEPHRRYHTLGHLIYMFNTAFKWGILDDLNDAEILAIFYHDAIYDLGPDRNKNEERSAALLHDLASSNYRNHPVNLARRIICDTGHHFDDYMPEKVSHRVLDLDLAVFAESDYLIFQISNKLVREEFGITKDQHVQFLKEYVQPAKSLFYTQPDLADTAHSNLKRYIGEKETDEVFIAKVHKGTV